LNRASAEAFGVTTSNGISQDLGGNSLPNSPEHTVKLGAAYTFPFNSLAGNVMIRLDYYWQDDMYAREFNTIGDEIDSWDQINLSLIYESTDGKWSGRFWARNLADEDNITGHYLTSDTSGFYRNYFLTEPRIFGASFRYTFGG
jgi:outer membrane receptor for ferric coprogen and ferric-rhodotorulic acid